jgi:dimeric dUTPase (all-alpha-NTP-PPase superfamily)
LNLTRLFELQKELDERIVREKGLEGQDLLPMKILALQVELGELANCWRGFKYWSNDQAPRKLAFKRCDKCNGTGVQSGLPEDWPIDEPACEWCDDGVVFWNPLLEEYVDCLHFILSIGLEFKVHEREYLPDLLDIQKDIDDELTAFAECFNRASDLQMFRDTVDLDWTDLMRTFIRLGALLGFTWEEVEQAYIAKNAVNHERQANGY